MKTVILNGADYNGDKTDQICEMFAEACGSNGCEVEMLTLRDMEIADCMGEFNCWIKTPGKCMTADEGQRIPQLLFQSHTVVMVTPITYGGHSYHLKKALDRIIPFVSPDFTIRDGEVHHKKRYERHPNFIAMGTLPEEDQEQEKAFRNTIRRQAVNMDGPTHLDSVILEGQSTDEVREEIQKLLREVGVVQ